MSDDETECHWCDEEVCEEQKKSNVVSWGPFVACDYCMDTMCEICVGPCQDICENCSRVCHAYPCTDISKKCVGSCSRCACFPKDGIEMDVCSVCNKKLNADEQEEHNCTGDENAVCDKCQENQ